MSDSVWVATLNDSFVGACNSREAAIKLLSGYAKFYNADTIWSVPELDTDSMTGVMSNSRVCRVWESHIFTGDVSWMIGDEA